MTDEQARLLREYTAWAVGETSEISDAALRAGSERYRTARTEADQDRAFARELTERMLRRLPPEKQAALQGETPAATIRRQREGEPRP